MKQSNYQSFAFPPACFSAEQSSGSLRIDHNIGTDNAFLTINPCYTGHGGIVSNSIQIDMQSDEEEDDESELFFDMDVSSAAGSSPMWESRQLTIHKQEELGDNGDTDDDDDDEAEGDNRDIKEEEEEAELGELYNDAADIDDNDEFEFSMTWSEAGSTLIPDCHYHILADNNDQYMISPADDLFYKGQLLPLHLPPRIKMVEELSSCSITSATGLSINHADNLCVFDADLTKPAPDLIKDKNQELGMKPGMTSIKHAVIPSVSNCSSRPAGQPVHGAAPALVQKACMEADHSTSVTRHLCTPINSSWLDMQDPNVFPQCYQDPSLNLIGGGGPACKSDRTSLKWKVYLPGIWRLRSSSSTNDDHSGPIESTELNVSSNEGKIKQGSWAVMSMFIIRASGSVLRIFFFNGSASGQQQRLMIRREGEEEEKPPWPSSKSNLNSTLDEFNVCDTGHGFAAGIASHASNSSSSSSYCSYSSSSASSSTSSPSHTKQKGYMSIGKANQYLSKYAKIFKSVYVYVLSYSKGSSASAVDSDHHNDRHLRQEMGAPPLKSAASLMGLPKNPKSQVSLKEADSSFAFTKRLGNDLISCNNSSHGFPPATTNISPLSAPYNCSSKRSASSTEVDNGIQGAIAHCKRSSAQSSQYPEDSPHPHSRTTSLMDSEAPPKTTCH